MLRRLLLIAFAVVLPCSAMAQGVARATPGGVVIGDGMPAALTLDTTGRLITWPAGASNFGTSQATAATTPTLLSAARAGRGAVTIENLGTTAVYIGGPGVTSTTGFLLPGTVGASVTIPTSAAVYGVVATGTQTVAVLESY